MSEIQTYKFYAGNRWHEPSSEKYFESEDPSIGKVWAKIPDCNEQDINLAVSSAKQAYYDGPYGKMHPAERARSLTRIGESIAKNADGLIAPSKLYSHLAAGTPIAAIAPKNSYLRELIDNHN